MNTPYPNWGRRRSADRSRALSAEDEANLIRAWQERGDERARERLLNAFAPMAVAMARRFSGGRGVADPDLVQQANIGLMKALDRFDLSRGRRFSTYAVWWVRAEVQEYRRTMGSIVRRPNSGDSGMRSALSRLDGIHVGDDARIAQELGIEQDALEAMRARAVRADASLNVSSLDDKAEDRLANLVDPDSIDPGDRVDWLDQQTLRDALVRALSDLPDRERDIILATQVREPAATLEELGQRHRISKERVRQLRERALERMREALSRSGARIEAFI
ncbi:RNA polymerase sigma-32 factor [Albidovulum inexpectatum]|uniref:RNA polymerase sigma-32 factor n=1 Tax=Albidovulum inexpectatum TaxID=196587 RepID=A0A2S5JEQ7_9RHOB|nr:sigma-70 family RNA polymerase sigma factor [Albidovulum inexpectatum]PPB79977.1 RNA polymerase sigma-32 factor [Albidovulum inexpectatum]